MAEADTLQRQQAAAAKAREALAKARANGTIKKTRKERKARARVTTFSMNDAGALTISDGPHAWPLTVEETVRLDAFLYRWGEHKGPAA